MWQLIQRLGEFVAEPDKSAFSIDWRLAMIGILMLTGGLTVLFEGLPWQTKEEAQLAEKSFREEQTAAEKVWDAKFSALIGTETANASAISANNTQIGSLNSQLTALQQREADDRRDIDAIRQHDRINQLEKRNRASKLAEQKNEESFDRQLKAMEKGFIKKQAVGL